MKEKIKKGVKKMGEVKDEMKKTPRKEQEDTVFGRFKKRNKKETEHQAALTLADHINVAEDKLKSLIVKKQAELDTEKGREDYNRNGLSILTTMQFHLDKLVDSACEYSGLDA